MDIITVAEAEVKIIIMSLKQKKFDSIRQNTQ